MRTSDRAMTPTQRKRRRVVATLVVVTTLLMLILTTTDVVRIVRRDLFRVACPDRGVVSAQSGGRLGNKMWEYAAAHVVAQRTGLQPIVDSDIRAYLDELFERLTVPALDMLPCPSVWDQELHGNLLNSPNASSIQINNFLGPDYGGLVDLIVNHRPDIRSQFIFHKHLRDHAQQVLLSARRSPATVFVGVHVRRTDYERHLRKLYGTTQALPSFYQKAMDYFRQRFQDAVFIVVSDDTEWCRVHLTGNNGDMVIVAGTAAQDMATLASCDHSIIDYGTFGEWTSMLAGGETIVYDLTRYNDHTSNLAKLLHWHIIS